MRFSPRFRSSAYSLIPAFLLTSLAGCGESDKLPREPISGSVTVEGKPLKSGLITFIPNESNTPTQGGALILEGKYSVPKNQGLVPGKYRIIITSPDDKPAEIVDKANNAPGMPPLPAKEVIPKQYNSESLLSAEVTAGGKNVFEFNLVSTPIGK
jgi:hypothetical protein